MVSNPDATDHMMGTALDYRSRSVRRAGTRVADARDRNAAHRKVGSADTGHLATVAGRIVQADNVWHGLMTFIRLNSQRLGYVYFLTAHQCCESGAKGK